MCNNKCNQVEVNEPNAATKIMDAEPKCEF